MRTMDRIELSLTEDEARVVLIACLALRSGFPELDSVILELERHVSPCNPPASRGAN
jgi:hypothetical protein